MNRADQARETALFQVHRKLGARMIPFSGWAMPVQYDGVIVEHLAVRQAAGLFDVSHMGELEISGADAEACLQKLTPNDVAALQVGQAQYSALLTPRGTFVDDLLVYRLGKERFLLVVNAANTAGDLDWMRRHARGRLQILDRSSDFALLALQGPRSREILTQVLKTDLSDLAPFHFLQMENGARSILVARTGYTGEDGFEIALPPEDAADLWDGILRAGKEKGIRPAGLGARDTLRLEAGLCLYGHDIDDTTTPWEAGLAFIVKMEKGEFIGRDALVSQKKEGVRRRLSGFRVTGRGIARAGHAVHLQNKEVGKVTSGTHSPSLRRSIGLVYLPADQRRPGTELTVKIRQAEVPAEVVSTPFYRRDRNSWTQHPAKG
ncbi:MAG: glycine cleavage system aminomethyltransferase GcvT [Acidobacteriota bacterium]